MNPTNYTVLIIDDDARNVFALKATLKSKGFNCRTASAAKEAFDILNAQKDVNLILLDMMMPDMDGYEALQKLRKDPVLSRIPAIAVTAQAMSGDKEKCLAAGANAYLSKPIDVDKLMEVLEQYLPVK